MSRNDTLLYTRYYADNYEEVHVGDTIYRYYYVYTPDGLSMIAERIGNTMNLKLYSVETDYLGSIVSLYNYKGQTEFRAEYDAWGRQNVVTDNLTHFQRGYCAHEHWHEFDLIDMNGRMYDPIIARFLSPDPFVQAPEDLQNYNRYSYCLNNPLKYTDPSGESVLLAAIIGAVIFGSGNLAVQAYIGEIDNFKDGLKAFGSGAIAGFALGSGIAAGLSVPILGATIKTAGCIYAGTTALSTTYGIIEGAFNGEWSHLKNTGKILAGNFYLNSKKNLVEQIWQGISRFSRELPQTVIGYGLSQIRNTFDAVDRVDYFDGVTYSTDINEHAISGWGVSLGNFINIKKRGTSFDVLTDPHLMHEYGHTFDSSRWGLSYLLTIGFPSAIGANYTEYRANRFAEKYFGINYDIDWSNYIQTYPLSK